MESLCLNQDFFSAFPSNKSVLLAIKFMLSHHTNVQQFSNYVLEVLYREASVEDSYARKVLQCLMGDGFGRLSRIDLQALKLLIDSPENSMSLMMLF